MTAHGKKRRKGAFGPSTGAPGGVASPTTTAAAVPPPSGRAHGEPPVPAGVPPEPAASPAPPPDRPFHGAFPPWPGPAPYPDFESALAPPATLADPPAEVVEAQRAGLRRAMDAMRADDDGLLRHAMEMGQYPVAQFVGYQALSALAENGLIQACVGGVVDDMLRNWIEVVRRSGDQGPVQAEDDKLKEIEDALERFRIRDLMRRAALCAGFFGGCLIFVDTGGFDLAEPLDATPASGELRVGGLRRFRLIEPVNVCPGRYNSWDPLADDFYEPSSWIVSGRWIHASRLLRVHGGLPPQLLLPAYNFFGVPRAQILWDYVMHFQRDRVSASDLLRKFSTKILKTDMTQILTGGAGDGLNHLMRRLEMLRRLGDNDSIMALDKEKEEFVKVETPLGGVTDIVQQALELICAVNGTPVVKTLGLSPKGFNATGEVDLRNYYDRIRAMQEQQLAPALEVILRLLQLHLFGAVDDTIGFNFKPLSEDDKKVKAEVQKALADVAQIYLANGVVSPEEVRQNLIADKDSGFDDVDLEDLPEMDPYEGLPAGAASSGASAPAASSGAAATPPAAGAGAGEAGAALVTAAPPAPPEKELTPQQQVLAGGQITSLLEIIGQVASGAIPRSSGLAIIETAFNLSPDQAKRILGDVGLPPATPLPAGTTLLPGPGPAPAAPPAPGVGDRIPRWFVSTDHIHRPPVYPPSVIAEGGHVHPSPSPGKTAIVAKGS